MVTGASGEPQELQTIAAQPEEFETFYREHLPFVRLYLARRVDDPFVIADLTPDVFLRAIRSVRTYREELGPPRAWLTGIARNVAADHHQSRAREAAAVTRLDGRRLLDEDSTDRIVQRIAAETTARTLLSSITKLPTSLRSVVELVAVDGLTQLDTFEAALLDELKAAARWYISIGAVAAAALGVALLVPALKPVPAYAVSGRNGGEVTVRVNRIEGADGLEQALHKHGIAADVTYLPAGKACAPGRYGAVETPGLTLSVGADRFEVTIPPGAVGKNDWPSWVRLAKRAGRLSAVCPGKVPGTAVGGPSCTTHTGW